MLLLTWHAMIVAAFLTWAPVHRIASNGDLGMRLHPVAAGVVIVAVAKDVREIRDLGRLASWESNYRPEAMARSHAGDLACGIWQVQPRWHAGVTCSRLMHEPFLSAMLAMKVYREMRRACGRDWHWCWKLGPAKARKMGKAS